MNIAIVEDEQKLAAVLEDYLQQAGFNTTTYTHGTTALEHLQLSIPDLILLDLNLPGTDGIAICQQVRKSSDVPVIMTTARVEEIDRLLGLEIGADDYICKPYSPREVVARVKAVLRRNTTSSTSNTNENFALDEQAAVVRINGQPCELTAVELKLLKTMVNAPGRIFSRNQLMTRIYPDNRIVSDRTIDSHIKKLRQRIEKYAPSVDYIHSVYGIGYKFEAPDEA